MIVRASDVLRILAEPEEALATLVERYREDTDRKEWALVSKSKDSKGHHKILRWFGTQKPSKERLLKEERRIQYFKHQ